MADDQVKGERTIVERAGVRWPGMRRRTMRTVHCRAMEIWNEAWREWDAGIDEMIEEGRDQVAVVNGPAATATAARSE